MSKFFSAHKLMFSGTKCFQKHRRIAYDMSLSTLNVMASLKNEIFDKMHFESLLFMYIPFLVKNIILNTAYILNIAYILEKHRAHLKLYKNYVASNNSILHNNVISIFLITCFLLNKCLKIKYYKI